MDSLTRALEHRTPSQWICRAITHLSGPADKPIENEALYAISVLTRALSEATR